MSPRIRRLVQNQVSGNRKLGVIVALTAISLLLWGRLMLKNVPRTVSANWGQPLQADNIISGCDYGKGVFLDIPHIPGQVEYGLFKFVPKSYKQTLKVKDESGEAKNTDPVVDGHLRSLAVIEAAQELRLNKVAMGTKPHAMINGLLVMPGQNIEDFTLVRILDQAVVLKKDGIRIRIRM